MQTKALVGGVAVLFLAMSMSASAYHIQGNANSVDSSNTSETWDNTAGTGLVIDLCESDGPLDPVNDAPDAHGGIGGLCYADSTYLTLAPADWPPDAADQPPADAWGSVQPTFDSPPATGGFFIRTGSNAHSCTGNSLVSTADEFVYNETLAFWIADGHVTFFIDDPATTGSFNPGATTDPGAGYCNLKETVALV